MDLHQNIEAEKMLFGCILLDNTIMREVEVQPEHFTFIHAHIFKAMQSIDAAGEEINLATLHEKLGESAMAQADFAEMMGAVPSPESYKMYEKMLLRSWKVNKARERAKKFIENTESSIDESEISAMLSDIGQLEEVGTKTDDFNLKAELDDMYDKAYDGVVKQGLLTGFVEYDRMTNGHDQGQLIIVAARPSVGKTAFALNVALGHMSNGAFGHLYSLEMGKQAFLNRMITARGRLHNEKMRNPKKRFNSDDWGKYSMAMSEMRNMHMYIGDKSTVKLSEIYARTRRLMRMHPDKKHFVMIDYLQLLNPMQRRGNRQEEVSEISRALKNMATDLGIPVIALSQLSRAVESRQEKRPMLSDIRESGSIEQDADVVAFLYRDDYYNKEPENSNIIEIIIAKQREGAVGTVELAFIKEYNLFVNLDRRYS